MDKPGLHIIRAIHGRWIALRLAAILVQGLGIGLLGYCLSGAWGLLLGLLFIAAFMTVFLRRKPGLQDVSAWLNQQFPELEDSTGIFLKPAENYTLLEQLQVSKITPRLQLIKLPLSYYKPVWNTVMLWALLLPLCWLIGQRERSAPAAKALSEPPIEKVIPGIRNATITIVPPAYTGRPTRTQQAFHITAEDSAEIRWEIHTRAVPQQVMLYFSDSAKTALQPDVDSTTWTATRRVTHTGFYQVKVDSMLSGFYQLQLIPDHPPLVKISSPAQNTVIDFGKPPLVNIAAQLSDDYGIASGEIIATIASGSGEAVRFREQRFSFAQPVSTRPLQANVSRQLNLAALGMKPGDELYFHIAVTDTRKQETLSDVYIVTLPDTAALFSLDGMVNAVNIKPEYFRSQRQIILETEALIRDKDSLGVSRFNAKSNDLGTDQKLLRLRYGKFLGEESESNIGDSRIADHDHDDHDHAHHQANVTDFGNAEKILDEFTDKHDNAEDATFFDPEIKKQLKATLTEMWKAELQLRLNKPQEALPFEYRALRLLKDLQQKSRAFVPKTGIKTTPLKPEKRLSGEQDKVSPAIMKQVLDYKDKQAPVRAAVSVLDHLQRRPAAEQLTVLQQALQQLTAAAAREPGKYLAAMEALQRITNGAITSTDTRLAQQGLMKLLTPAALPQPAPQPAGALQEQYFKNLKKPAL